MVQRSVVQEANRVTAGKCALLAFAAFVMAGLSFVPLIPADLLGKVYLGGVWVLVGVRWGSQWFEIRQAAGDRDVPEVG
ncbi:MAG: hypothetical protein JSV86_14700 [Gemmatimonadota bacterium]|nr:MAG: hypothetical protein JSV86_14700 [Gemmatimonadota bacterium]